MRSASSFNRHSLLEEDPVTNFVVLPNLQEDVGTLREPLEKLCCSPLTEICMRIVLTTEAREGLNTQDKAERLMAETGRLFEEMVATFHPPGVAGGLQAKSSDVQWALRQLWMKNGVEHFQFDLSSVFMAVGVLTHPGAATHPFFWVEMFVFRVALLDLCTDVHVSTPALHLQRTTREYFHPKHLTAYSECCRPYAEVLRCGVGTLQRQV